MAWPTSALLRDSLVAAFPANRRRRHEATRQHRDPNLCLAYLRSLL